MFKRFTIALAIALMAGTAFHATQAQSGARAAAPTRLRFLVSFPATRGPAPRDGRIILVVSNNDRQEPRFQNNAYDARTQLSFGIDVEGLKPGQDAVIDGSVFGYPLASIADIPPGDYFVQAVFHQYETFHRGDGHVVKLPMDRGEGQHWNRAPGNLLNKPVKVHVDPRTATPIRISLDEEIPPLPEPKDTKYVKYVRFQSERLTKFWGRPMYLGAIVVLPEGFDEHPDAHYPLMINHGHFTREMRGFLPVAGTPAGGRGGQFFADWTGPGFPRMIMLIIQHANPYYDDSYAVNSENVGPYGDAINDELVPYIEKRYRGIGQGWAPVPIRSTSGSTRRSTSTRRRTPSSSTATGRRRRTPTAATTWITSRRRSKRTCTGSTSSGTRPGRASSGPSGKPSTVRWAPTATRSRSGIR
jgi:hypothetical protein